MEEDLSLRATSPRWNGRGHLRAHIQASFDGELLVADTIDLDVAAARRKLAESVIQKLDGRGPAPDAIEARLLAMLAEVTTADGADDADGSADTSDADGDGSQADGLVRLAGRSRLFHDPAGETYARVPVGDHEETWATRSKSFKRHLVGEYYRRYGKAPGAQALAGAMNVIEAQAQFDGPCESVYIRVAPDGASGLYLDLGDSSWRAIHVTPFDYKVVADPPVNFRRSAGMLALPVPIPGGSLDELRGFVNVPDDDAWALLTAWLVAAVRDRGPYPILALVGEQGSAKTSLARMLRALVDPATPDLRAPVKELRDLAIAARANWAVAFDNISHIQPWLSDALCRLATGGGWATRELYADLDEVLFEATRPVILNGITEFTTRPDLLDRAIQLVLPEIPDDGRRDEQELWGAFEAARPRLLGALLDRVVGALRELPRVRLDRKPRMADFALWAVAAERACAGGGVSSSAFLSAYAGIRESGWHQAIEGSVIGGAFTKLLDAELVEGAWAGTAKELLARLVAHADEQARRDRQWPKTPRGLSGELRRLAPALRGTGVRVDFGDRAGRKGNRIIRLERTGTNPPTEPGAGSSAPSARSAPGSGPPDGADDGRPNADDGAPAADGRPLHADGSHGAADGADGIAVASSSRRPVHLITDPDGLAAVLPQLMDAAAIGLDTETTGLDPRSHRIRLVQLALTDKVYVIDAFRVDPRLLAPLFTRGPRLVGHNLKFDLNFLAAAGLPLPDGARLFDTMLAAQLLGAGTDDGRLDRCGLAAVAWRRLGTGVDKSVRASDWSGPLTDAQVAYAANDAAVVLTLAEALEADLEAAGLGRAAALEMRALPAIAWLERAGAPFDRGAWADLSDGAVAEQIRIEAELADLVGDATINWRSVPQVERELLGRGHAVDRTDEATLARLAPDEPIARALLRYREASRRTSAYGIEFLRYFDETTGRIHPDYLQIGAASGRMACRQPNLQQVPRDPAYRACFRPAAGRVLVKADYSQIELRIAAEIAKDPRMLDAYLGGSDLHTVTAAAVLGRTNGSVTKGDRQLAKAINFGLLYGMGAERLRQHAAQNYGVWLTLAQAEEFRAGFFRAYPGLRAWHQRQGNAPSGASDTRTLAGRRRLSVERYTERLNTPVQGTGADGLKAALALLWETQDRVPSATPVLCIHDELVLEVDEAEAEAAADWLVECMTRGMRAFVRKVPVEVDVAIMADWSGVPVITTEGAIA